MTSYHHHWRKWELLQLTIFIVMMLGGVQLTRSIRLDRDGGYSLLVGVDLDDKLKEPEVESSRSSSSYLENILSRIKSEFEELSIWMHSATRGRFHIKHVDILLHQSPQQQYSNLVKTDGLALAQTYKNADVQISSGIRGKIIQVRNPNGCGMPGQSMKVPLERYHNLSDDKSVLPGGKSLLPYFSRYRWGVFEETGMESDPQRYPEFYRDDKGAWHQTSCVNHTARTSLMSQAWVEGVKEFCDEGSHNKLAPTPQNILCGYRSVLEVIRSTEDWKYVKEEEAIINRQPDPVTFKLLRRSDKPYLYFMVDRQISNGSLQVMDGIGREVASMLNYLDSSIVTQIAVFPGRNEDVSSSSSVEILAPWSPSSQLRTNFTSLFNSIGGAAATSSNGNFATALFEVAKFLLHLDHPEGTVVVLLKAAGARAPTSFSKSGGPHTFEHDMIASLKTAGVRLHALEIRGDDGHRNHRVNLENLVEKVGGSHLALDSHSADQDRKESLRRFVEHVEGEFGGAGAKDDDHLAQDTVAVYRGFIPNGTEDGNTFHPGGNLHRLQLFLSSGVPLSSIMVNDVGFPMEEGGLEWNMDDDGYGDEHRYVHHSELAKILKDLDDKDPINVKFECEKGDRLCDPYLVILGDVDQESGWEPTVQISTSSITDFFDWNLEEDSSKPLHIYAEMTSEMIPGYRVDFTGVLCGMGEESSSSSCQSFPMIDDGLGEPDILKGDGVHSAGFLPERDGRYYAKVMCTVWGQDDDKPLMTRTFDHDSILTFVGTGNRRKPSIRRINDLHKVEEDGDGSEMKLEWTAPLTYGPDGKMISAEMYDLRYAPRYLDLIKDFEGCSKPRVEGSGLPKPDKPGTRQRVKVVGMEGEEENDVFFAMRSSSSGIQSEASNLVSSGFVPPPIDMQPQPPKIIRVMRSSIEDEEEEDEVVTEVAPEVPEEDLEDLDQLNSSTEPPITEISSSAETDPPTTTEDDSSASSPTSEEGETETETEAPTTTMEPTTLAPTTTTSEPEVNTPPPPPPDIADDEQFFKKPIGYITAGVGGGVILVGLGGAVGYLYWKRRRLINSGRLKLHNEI